MDEHLPICEEQPEGSLCICLKYAEEIEASIEDRNEAEITGN